MKYCVYSGEYPFTNQIGFVDAPADEPETALLMAKEQFPNEKAPVVEPLSFLLN